MPKKATPQRRRAQIEARYDAAATTVENRRHWINADHLSPTAANAPEIRAALRNRSRYEVANNSYARGIVDTLANYTIGTGPRLQMLLPDVDDAVNTAIEDAFATWANDTGLAEKLRVMRKARAQDGEAFGALITNPAVRHAVKLDLRPFEADLVAAATFKPDPLFDDGIRYDAAGQPVSYQIQATHPGDAHHMAGRPRILPASHVIHWFKADRPGQRRGIPELTPALPLFANLRSFTLAVLAAAETAADFAVILHTDHPASGEAAELTGDNVIELERRKIWIAPEGWSAEQVKAEQPTTTYGEFKEQILNEIARCLNVPFNVAAGNSSKYNYASGRLDHQAFFKTIRVDQGSAELVALAPILREWLIEADRAGILPVRLTPEQIANPPAEWFWDGIEHVDPVKEAKAEAIALANHTTTLADAWGRKGQDWRAKLQQRRLELQTMRELGIPSQLTPPTAAE